MVKSIVLVNRVIVKNCHKIFAYFFSCEATLTYKFGPKISLMLGHFDKGRLKKKKHYKLGFSAEVRGGRGQRGFQGPNLLMVII